MSNGPDMTHRVPLAHLLAALLVLTTARAVEVTQTAAAVAVANATIRVVAPLTNGRAGELVLIDVASGEQRARLHLGLRGGWTAACVASASGQAGSLVLSGIDTSSTAGSPVFAADSEIRIALRDEDPFPLVRLRLRAERFDQESWNASFGGSVPLVVLTCSVPDAELFYRGGFTTPLPALDPFPVQSPLVRGAWHGQWIAGAECRALPVPAAGLWSPSRGLFAGCEWQAVLTDESGLKHAIVTCCAELPGLEQPVLALAMSPNSPVDGSFRLIHSDQVPAASSPNEFMVQHIWQRHRDTLPPVPAAPDLGWMPRRADDHAGRSVSATVLRQLSAGHTDDDALFFPDGALLPAATRYTEIRRLLKTGSADRVRQIVDQCRTLLAKQSPTTIGEDMCVRWRFPLEGDYAEEFGGQGAATFNGPGTWKIGTALLAMAAEQADPTLLETVDGILRWSRHCAYTRGGDVSRPGAMASASVDACATEFLLAYYIHFRDATDKERRKLALEALSLGRSAVYRYLTLYTGDPDGTDNVDPTFLIQADGATASFGTVSWADTGPLLRALALYVVETGDPVLSYFLRGALQRRMAGSEADGLHVAQLMVASGAGPRALPVRWGQVSHDGVLVDSLRPFAGARLRVLCGRTSAAAFTDDAKLGVRGYRTGPGNSFGFLVVGSNAGDFDVNVTVPFADLDGKPVFVNGRRRTARVLGVGNETLLVSAVRVGDAVSVGSVTPPLPPKPGVASGVGSGEGATHSGQFRLHPLEPNAGIDTSWRNGRSWAGLTDGPHVAWGVPFNIGCGDGRVADLSQGPLVARGLGPCSRLYIFAARSETPITATVTYTDGARETLNPGRSYPALVAPPVRRWRIDMHPVALERRRVDVTELEITGDSIVFALTSHPSGDVPGADRALAGLDRQRETMEEEMLAAARDLERPTHVFRDLRASLSSAMEGKQLRIGFLPPDGPYADLLRTACVLLGSSPALLSPEEVVDPDQFDPARYPIVIYSGREAFLHTVKTPGDAAEATKRYLARGGCLCVVSPHPGYPFYYAMAAKNGRFERVEGTRNSATCAELQIPIRTGEVNPAVDRPRFERTPDDDVFAHLPSVLPYGVPGRGYRLASAMGLPAEDRFTPFIVLRNGEGDDLGAVAAQITHACDTYRGGRVQFLWGDVLGLDNGLHIAAEFMAHAMRSAPLTDVPERMPAVAILPRDVAGHEAVIQRACDSAGLDTYTLSPEEFADPAVFNPRNFPIAIHAVKGEYYLNAVAGRSNLWQSYVDYVKGGGFLVCSGNMLQFHYAGVLSADGSWRQPHDRGEAVRQGLGLVPVYPSSAGSRSLFLRCLEGQNIVTFDSLMPLDYISIGAYRAIGEPQAFGIDMVPIADVVDGDGIPFGGRVIAALRYTAPELQGAEMLWFWGNLLDDSRAHPLFEQAIRYAYEKRRRAFKRPQ